MDPLSRDAPGDMELGETVVVRSVLYERKGATVTYDVFGSHVSTAVKHPPEEEGARNMRPMVRREFSDRSLSDDQAKYLRALTVVVAGTALGWFDADQNTYLSTTETN